MRNFSRALSVLAISCSFWMALQAQQPSPTAGGVPRLVKFSGTVKAATGQTLAGTTGLTFAVYQNQQGGAALWIETQNVALDSQGNYTVLLGSTGSDGLPLDLFVSGDSRWLGVQAQGQDEQPRVLLVSVPYALKAADAETLGGKPLSAFVLTDPQPSASSSASSTTTSSSAADSGQRIISRLATTVGGGGTQNFIAKWDSSGVNLVNTTAPIYDDGSGHVGFGTTTPAYLLDVNGNAQINGTQFINSGGGYTHWDLPYNMNLISAGNNFTGFGYNWQYLFNSGSPFLNKPQPDSSFWMQFSNSQISFNYNTSTTVGAMTSTPAAVILNNGNVGIGTTTPTARLHVFSNTGADSNYTFENASPGVGSYFSVKSNSPFAAAVIQSSDGKWAFGRFGGSNSFQIQDLANNKQPFVIEGNSVNNAFYITAAGNVGLGTFLPLNKLDVLGAAALGAYGGVNAAPSNGLIVSGNVGIGTASPGYKLDVQGGQINASGGLCIAGSCLTSWPGIVTSVTASSPLASSAGSTPNISLTGIVPIANGGTGVNAAQGNGTKVQLSAGATTTNDCVKFDANGNTMDAGGPCGAGGVSLTAANTFTVGPQTIQTGADGNKGVIVKANSATQSANLQEWEDSSGAALASIKPSGVLVAPPGMLLRNASFYRPDGTDSAAATFNQSDGIAEAHTCDPTRVALGSVCANNALDDTLASPQNVAGSATGLDRPGAFVSARARWIITPQTGFVFYVLAGGANQYATGGTYDPTINGLQNGFGFKAVAGALNGITILNGTPTLVDLSTALTNGTWVDLMAVRRGSAVQFYVNGVLKGSSTTNLPTTAASSYQVRVENGATISDAAWQVGYVTTGIPIF